MKLLIQETGKIGNTSWVPAIGIIVDTKELPLDARPLALCHELGHVATLKDKRLIQIVAAYPNSTERQAAELMAWVWAFSKRGGRRGIRKAAKSLASYHVPYPYSTLSGLLDMAGVPKGRKGIDKQAGGVVDLRQTHRKGGAQ